MSKNALFSAREDELCPLCGAKSVIRSGKHGAFQGCSRYPQCDYIRPLRQQADSHTVKILAGQHCPECQANLALRQGRYGMFIGCSHYPECQHTEAIDQPDKTSLICPQCQQGKLVQRRSRYGKIFHACECYPNCQFTVSFTPIAGECAYCRFPLLFEKKMAHGMKWFCASRTCGQPFSQEKQ